MAGTATEVPQLLAGRVLQGLGTQAVAIYVLVALVHDERDRPAAFGLLAAAWVAPTAAAPTAAGLVTAAPGMHDSSVRRSELPSG